MKKVQKLLSGMLIFSLLAIAACDSGSSSSGGGGTSVPDTTPPVIVSTTPVTGATGIAKNSTISVSFSEAVDPATVDTNSFIVNNGTVNLSGTVAMSSDNITAVFTCTADMAYDLTHTVTIKASVADMAGNELGTDGIFSFTTGAAPDTTPPTVSVNPANNAVNFGLSGNVELTFSEAMNPVTINNTNIQLLQGASTVGSTVTYNTGTHIATINPTVDLDYSTIYTVKVYTGAADASGNTIASVFTSTFTTIADTTPPSVSSHAPLSDATGVAKGTNITITFSERLLSSTVTSSNITVVKKSNNAFVAGTVTYDDASKTATFNPTSDLEAGPTTYTVTVGTGIKDLHNNSMISNVTWDFTTTDGTGPTVSSHTPLDGATGQSVVDGITITFSEPINTSTLTTSNITIKDAANNNVPGTFTYTSGTMTATFVPTYNLNYQKIYTVTVGTGVKDVNGNSISASSNWSFTTKTRHWTVMYYGDADCNLEAAIMTDIAEMKNGYVDDQGIDIVILIDRHPSSVIADGYSADSTTLGSNFTDTRLYRITNGKAVRISGSTQYSQITTTSTHEANMGDALTLKKFIQFCKANYPASNYSLILSNHGGGVKSAKNEARIELSKGSNDLVKDICYDETSTNDFLYTSEISNILTSSESVDLFGLDACLMSSVEFAYQYRNDVGNTGFKANIMVASAPTETGNGWEYTAILNRLKSGGGNNGTSDLTLIGSELYYDPATLTAAQFGAIIVEEQRDSTITNSSQSLTCLDLSKIKAVKVAVDLMSVKLWTESEKSDMETLRGNAPTANLLHYFDENAYDGSAAAYTDWLFYPYFDVYNLVVAINSSSNFSVAVKADAVTIRDAVDDLVVYSFANSDFSGFTEGKSGVHIFFPDGDEQMYLSNTWLNQWYLQDWYNSLNISSAYVDAPLGQLSWCIDGINTSVNTVGNWFELLDCWYDTQLANDADGGFNYYQW
ncbi:MAG: clostripain [Spirochaetes bacterium]|nr:clostripain [Spirochaetota bacterium]